VPSPRQPASGASCTGARWRSTTISRGDARRPVRLLRLVPHLRRRRGVRDGQASSAPRDLPQPPAVVLGVGEGLLERGRALGRSRARSRVRPRNSPRRAHSRWPACTPGGCERAHVYDPFTVVSLMQIEDMGFCRKRRRGDSSRATRLHHDAGKLPFNTPRRACSRTRTCSASRTSSSA
jgi:hypothetical protein